LDHILEAVRHLEAAGMQAEADGLRRKCDTDMKAVVEQLKKAEAELATLKSASAKISDGCNSICESSACQNSTASESKCEYSTPKQVSVHIEMIEVNRTKCRENGFDFAEKLSACGTSACLGAGQFGVVKNQDTLKIFLNALRQDALAKVLCKPSVLTVSGRPAQAMIGQHIPVPNKSGSIEYHFAGTEVNVVPVIAQNGKIRLELRCKHSELVAEKMAAVNDQKIPTLSTTQVDTGIEIASGEIAVLTGLPTTRNDQGFAPAEVELLVFVLPEIIEPAKQELHTNWTLPFEACTAYGRPCAAAMPTCCDEGPVFTSACSTKPTCDYPCSSNFLKCGDAFQEPAVCDPFEPKVIDLPAVKFELPETFPAAKHCDGEFHSECTPAVFMPHMAKPMRFTRPVVAPVNFEEPVTR
jgi:hypothetical protein